PPRSWRRRPGRPPEEAGEALRFRWVKRERVQEPNPHRFERRKPGEERVSLDPPVLHPGLQHGAGRRLGAKLPRGESAHALLRLAESAVGDDAEDARLGVVSRDREPVRALLEPGTEG